MPLNPALCLTVDVGPNANVQGHDSNNGFCGLNLTLRSVAGRFGYLFVDPITDTEVTYTLSNVLPGMYFSNDRTDTGQAWRIRTITLTGTIPGRRAAVLVEDVNRYNLKTIGSLVSIVPSTSFGCIFEINSLGIPIFTTYPSNNAAQIITANFFNKLMARFMESSTSNGIYFTASQASVSSLLVGNTVYYDSTDNTYKNSNTVDKINKTIGIIIEKGPFLSVLKNPSTPYTRQLIDADFKYREYRQ